MYFIAFDENIASPLSPESTFLTEYLVSQLLVGADPPYLKGILGNNRLADAIYSELEFLGQIPKASLPKVKNYLAAQAKAPALRYAVTTLASHPDDSTYKLRVVTPLGEPTGP